ncbi:2-oxo-4-hydroxy-4-carboxy-5-ureidoimidazoline decarboxylase [Neorhizobium galegae]|uniref:2-oxo-4-hydroxy-4-carboxy-5-ureidoimidazoline decarboxylase n=1 Tax=Neorhizobium galegae TaxID=399 RepID=UPI00062142BE|nr:2-oxo-4-hydroxy-4-carboxy-5-ureidoimidazoline decarboxylase [Neorhizobium galegae]CDZ30801.1 OHCU decarboxylase [Neorhizobium galegae bv. officinalis]KAA9387971.1 2-oxo-4-hydroxy-4-carboxy-5-ureidoimidazoline decarboxylase [Neorhizobium galegae]KAB1115567.1 2-oxo-4-hydroxy-4-carboxy-5-ureidoimidazoline decarboxylase [Neorhizobium galegae]MCM2499614.1 2-oxo-4-hydroxy-4-carboxy-5-ureidoimidazoline decarboxylase [Neorhizobium galegae]MCQ1773472.1 2-oxo-4-hydroxy-4-carboxy-5-ureidoimidazoline d
MTARGDFIQMFGGVFEHSPFIAERAYDSGLMLVPLTSKSVHDALTSIFRKASREERLGVLRAHPDLAGKLAIAGELTEDSKKEQAGAGLDRLSPAEHARFTELNTAYTEKFGFPFIIAVKGLTKDDILAAFEKRIHNSLEEEFDTATAQVEKIALLRLQSLLPGH